MSIAENKETNFSIYDRHRGNMILRDWLALDRTVLANERTLLAWIRTALSIIVAGVGFIKFIEIHVIVLLGYMMIPTGLAVSVIGIYKYLKLHRELSSLKE